MFRIGRGWAISLGIIVPAIIVHPAFSLAGNRSTLVHTQIPRIPTAIALPSAVPSATPLPACLATQAYVAIPSSSDAPIDLNTADPVLSVDLSQSNPAVPGKAIGAGFATLGPLTFTMLPNALSDDLFTRVTGGGSYPEIAVLFVGTSGGVQTTCRTIVLKTAVVSKLEENFGPGPSGASGPVDIATVTYGSMSLTEGAMSSGKSSPPTIHGSL